MSLQIPYPSETLEIKLEEILRRGRDKLSQLFMVLRNDEEADFEKELPDKMIRDLRLNLKTFEWQKFITDSGDNIVTNFVKFNSELERQVDTNKLRIFFSRETPKNVILSTRVFKYPRISKGSSRIYKEVSGIPSHLEKYIIH